MKIGSKVTFNWPNFSPILGDIEKLKQWYDGERFIVGEFYPYNSNKKLYAINGIAGGFAAEELIVISE